MFSEQFKSYLDALDIAMREVVNSFSDSPSGFKTMIEYPLGWVQEDGKAHDGVTGKRVRPILLLACVDAAGGNWQHAVYAAAAVEILHNFSLVHDDIQDNSPTRHNRPTVWKVWGMPMAINSGDAMFALAYRAIEMLETTDLDPRTRLAVQRVFNRTILELTRGQYQDMDFESRDDVSVNEYISMVSGKTAALLAGTAEIGALIAGLDESIARSYARFGLDMGIAFQIRDDILGIWGEAAVTGKSAATDIVGKKKSVPILYGLDHSEELFEIFNKATLTELDVTHAVSALDACGAKQYALEMEKSYYDSAIAALEATTPSDLGKKKLIGLIEGLFKRSY